MILRCAAFCACLLILASCAGFCDDVTMGRYGPQQASFTSEKLEPPLILSWEFTSNRSRGNPAAPIVVGDTCFFAAGDRMYAVDTYSGNMKWKYPLEQPLTSTVKATPAYLNGKVYFGTGDGKLYCLNAETGTFEWFFETRAALRCPPVILDDIMFIGSDDNSIYTIHAETGDTAWTKPLTARDDFSNGLAVGSGMVVASCMDGNMYGINATSGKLRWPFRLPNAPVKTSPIMTENQTIMAVGSMVYGVATRSGQIKWTIQLPSEASASPATDGTDIFVPCHDKKLYCYNVTGRQPVMKWTEPSDIGGIPMSSPTVADQLVYVTASHGIVSAFSTENGNLKWRYAFAASQMTSPGSLYTDASSSPIVANGALFVLTDDGVLHCFTKAAPDTAAPDVFFASPANGTRMNGSPPIKFSALLYDVGSGVDFSSASIMLDGQLAEVETDMTTGTVSYTTAPSTDKTSVVKPLKDGVHIVTLNAQDYAGNKLTKEWSFVADSTMPPPRRSKVEAAVGKKTKDPGTGTRTRPGDGSNPGTVSPPPPPPPPMPGAPGAPGGTGARERGDWGDRRREDRHNRGNFDQPAPGQ